MPEGKKILIVEDELTNAVLLKRILSKAGYTIVTANNGLEALRHLEREHFDAVLTDWMMPQLDGIELIRRMREKKNRLPLIIMITALVSDGARDYALESGADDYIAKPIDVDELLARLRDGLSRHEQEAPDVTVVEAGHAGEIKPPCVGVVIGTSTGGPPTLVEIFKKIDPGIKAAFFVVQHGPPWMLETFAQRLRRDTPIKVMLAVDGAEIAPGNVYVAPGDRHLRIDASGTKIILDDGPKENFVRPAADTLFRSAAETFGKYCIAVVLTGLGRDGTQGAAQVVACKGTVLVQDPETAVAPSMPNSIVQSGIEFRLVSLRDMPGTISDKIFSLNAMLSGEQ